MRTIPIASGTYEVLFAGADSGPDVGAGVVDGAGTTDGAAGAEGALEKPGTSSGDDGGRPAPASRSFGITDF